MFEYFHKSVIIGHISFIFYELVERHQYIHHLELDLRTNVRIRVRLLHRTPNLCYSKSRH